MSDDQFPSDSDEPVDSVALCFPLDGYEALGLLVAESTVAGWHRLRTVRQRRRELSLLRAAYALPSHEVDLRRPAG